MNGQPKRVRADELVVQQGLAETRSRAKALIMAGVVRVGDRVIDKPGETLDPTTPLALQARLPYVSRGGLKLQHALDTFGIDVDGVVAVDIGASTGGFTDCLLQRGAAKVYAIDVGYGQLDYRLRNDRRVVVMERVNAREPVSLPEPVGFACIDVSFISLDLILPAVASLLTRDADVVALIKPQFEAGREHVGRGGVVRSPEARRSAVMRVVTNARRIGLGDAAVTTSPITGPAGNVEYLAWLRFADSPADADAIVETLFADELGRTSDTEEL
ncbi:MAG TPA: TlyA family RNA methyltransferase [Thermomicrobiales bacterium]|nr:TlyA family RNA methyltransferase [Thermomicrobiales bacterium]